ncbi:MAG: 3-deoxy-D-arabino-heptulosonate 7-phosphate synthase [Bordetella sp. SCN 67-23]|nr:3-deoxy-D-arabino-heptulosonate 7-phosphate synthase [Burkholderiales bacterium]ODS76431.1 MAG: 3-deoxy-D-arabino-heptulosonate 7-phosphate synthase [Bordetella sp. SCN 67-23]OJW86832.1 MAG: 3-deoxy-D-arabino-heptulosonate 7-phosphate synthase [Burkholderiales bacterium 67-32]
MLADILNSVPRRYRLPADMPSLPGKRAANPSAALALAIEQARQAVVRGDRPDTKLARAFTEALARLIGEAVHPGTGDPVIQAMVLRHRHAHVREYASLVARAGQDRRQVRTAVDAVAHPARLQRMPDGPVREALAQWRAAAFRESWRDVHMALPHLLAMPDIAGGTPFQTSLARLLDNPALARLQRLDALASDELVRHYQALWDGHGPRPGSAEAAAQGGVSQQRGKAVEASAARALGALAEHLEREAGAGAAYRVVTSMRVPSSIPASHERAKTEWDAVLLRRAPDVQGDPAWDVRLLVEAKASIEAATTDLPRLQRGVCLLAHAEAGVVYPFQASEGVVRLRGSSLRALSADEAGLARSVLYCCDMPAEPTPRLLGAAGRMQLLSALASLAFASALEEGRDADPRELEPVWNELLHAPGWAAVLEQYPRLRQVRGLMVHIDDLMAAPRNFLPG